MRERVPLFPGLALVAIGVVIGSFLVADGIRERNPSEGDVLTVTGSAKQRILSDYVVWNVALTSQPTTAAAAEQLGGWADRLRAFLESRGVRTEELTVPPISTESLTRRGNVYA